MSPVQPAPAHALAWLAAVVIPAYLYCAYFIQKDSLAQNPEVERDESIKSVHYVVARQTDYVEAQPQRATRLGWSAELRNRPTGPRFSLLQPRILRL